MAKRLLLSMVGVGMGSLVGLLVALLSGANPAIIICGILGGVLSLLVRAPEQPS